MQYKDNVTVTFNYINKYIMDKVEAAYKACGYASCTLTGGLEGTHSAKSLHYQGRALDFRTSQLRRTDVPLVVAKCKELLGVGYDVVLEKDHLHVEYDPK